MSRVAPESLSRRFELAHTELSIGGHHYRLLRPRCVDDLISEEDFAIDDRIPYWADCWPSARVLADRVARQRGESRQLLELGCGIGLVSLAAAHAGYRVLATDYYSEALEFTAANAERHAITSVDTRLVDWRRLPADLETFDVVAASDVLYERWQAAAVAAVIDRTLRADGLGLLTDPGRRMIEEFVDECAARGLKAQCVDRVAVTDGRARVTVSTFEIRRC